jgi:phage/plasmid-associated DNA primase
MDPSLHRILIDCKSKHDDPNDNNYSHFTYNDNKRWLIDSSKLQQFWLEYCSLIFAGRGKYTIGERINREYKYPPPVISLISLSFERSDSDIDFLYDEKVIVAMIICHQIAMSELLNMSCENDYTCVVLKSEAPYYDDHHIYFDIRLQFPYCKVDANYQLRVLRPRIISLLRKYNVLKKLDYSPIGDWDSILDPTILQNTLPLHKSVKNMKQSHLDYDTIYGLLNFNHMNGEDSDVPVLKLMDAFNPACHQDCVASFEPQFFIKYAIEYKEIHGEDLDFTFWLPLFLSAGYWDKITHPKGDNPIVTDRIKNITSPISSNNTNYDNGDINIAEKLLPLLKRNKDRVGKRNFWIDIGKALYSADNGGHRGLHLWINFSEGEFHTADECEELYESFEENDLTVKTIAYYAREDARDEYKNWHKSWCEKSDIEALSCTHEDVANALYKTFWLDYVCSTLDRGKTWYEFRDPRWFKIEKGNKLQNQIAGAFCRKFEIARAKVANDISTSTNNSDKKALEELMKEYSRLIKNLKNEGFQNNIMNNAARKFYIENFASLLDSNENLLGTSNLILETLETECIFRKGKPEDYVSLSTCKQYPYKLRWEDDIIQDILQWFKQLFVDSDLIHMVLKYFSGHIRGRNSIKKIAICTGRGGDNGKSTLKKACEAAFGQYAISGPTILLGNKAAESMGPNPAIARAAGRRELWFSEPDEKQEFSGAQLKSMSGGDKMYCRLLNENGGDMELYFHMIIHCNDIPELTSGGPAAMKRLLIIPFLSQWVPAKEAPKTIEEQYEKRKFKMNPKFEDNFKEHKWGPAFLWILVNYYHFLMTEGIEEPDIVKEVKENYRDLNDQYNMFIREFLEFPKLSTGEPDGMKCMTTHDMYNHFKIWYKETYTDKQPPHKPIFIREMSDRIGPPDIAMWRGVQQQTQSSSGIAQDPYANKRNQGNFNNQNRNVPKMNTGNDNFPMPMVISTQPGIVISSK